MMMLQKYVRTRSMQQLFVFCILLLSEICLAQDPLRDTLLPKDSPEKLDEIFISETENVKGKDKVLHAEPLYIDLIRDLGARKGEQEWNVGLGMTDRRIYDSYSALVEYEFAPVDRLGFEIELPFSFFLPLDSSLTRADIPRNRLNSTKLATQYSFYVNEKQSMSAALGYIHEFGMTSFEQYGKQKIFTSNVFNPFVVVAKRWGRNFHTLL